MLDVFIKKHIFKPLLKLIGLFQEKILLKLSHYIITNSEEMGYYLKERYSLNTQHFAPFPMGINVCDFSCSQRRNQKKTFTVFYGGAISEDRGFVELFHCIEQVNQTVPVDLVCCGRLDESLQIINRPWLHIITGLNYREYVEQLCQRADAGIIPYPPNEWWSKASISKLATYAAASIPILTTKLSHTEKFVRSWDCGFVAESWEEMANLILLLARNKDICRKKGGNARLAAEQSLDWKFLSEEFLKLFFRNNVVPLFKKEGTHGPS